MDICYYNGSAQYLYPTTRHWMHNVLSKSVHPMFCFLSITWIPLTGHSTAAGHRENWPSNCIFPRLLCFQKWKCQSESKMRLYFTYWFCRIPLLL